MNNLHEVLHDIHWMIFYGILEVVSNPPQREHLEITTHHDFTILGLTYCQEMPTQVG